MKKKTVAGQGTPLMRQYDEVKRQYSDAIVLFRMGDFYETFNDDAVTTAKVLGIVLTKRSNGAATDVPLAGFPHHAIDNYLCLLYTSPSPRDLSTSRMPSSA